MRQLRVVFLALAASALLASAAQAAPTVYAAASLRDAFPRIDRSATFSFGGSNTLQLQIERGAPADVFASADPSEAQALFREDRCTRPVTFATNILVLLVPKGNPGNVRSVYTLRNGGKRLAIGTAGVPIGDYTRRVLRRLGLSSVLTRNTVSQEKDVASIASKVALGSADAGFVYRTDALATRGRTREIRVPKWAQPPVRYQLCAVKRPGAATAAAQAFIKKVVGGAGRRILQRGGFGLPPRG